MRRWILTSPVLWTLCACSAPRTEVIIPEIPPQLLLAPARPAVPPPGATATDAALFLLDQDAALAQCIGQLETVAQIMEASRAIAQDAQK